MEYLDFVHKQLKLYENDSNPQIEEIKRMYFDAIRFARSLEWLSNCGFSGKRVLELGPVEAASFVIRNFFKDNDYSNTYSDLRTAFPFGDARFDFVLNMEIIEHMSDIEYGHRTYYTGLRHCLAECHRVLRPGGIMFLSTPNAASAWVIQRALLHQPPWLYENHFREYTPEELLHFVKTAGFDVLTMATEFVWHPEEEVGHILDFIKGNSYPEGHRGDVIFLVAGRSLRKE